MEGSRHLERESSPVAWGVDGEVFYEHGQFQSISDKPGLGVVLSKALACGEVVVSLFELGSLLGEERGRECGEKLNELVGEDQRVGLCSILGVS